MNSKFMKFDRLNQSITLLANVGVLAGIIFLGLEIQQNSEITRAQTRDAMTEKIMSFYSLIISDKEAAEIYEIGSSSFDELVVDSVEYTRYRWIVLSHTRMWENEWYQYQKGLFEPVEFESRLLLWEGVLRSRGYRSIWEGVKLTYAPEFRQTIDELIARSEPR